MGACTFLLIVVCPLEHAKDRLVDGAAMVEEMENMAKRTRETGNMLGIIRCLTLWMHRPVTISSPQSVVKIRVQLLKTPTPSILGISGRLLQRPLRARQTA